MDGYHDGYEGKRPKTAEELVKVPSCVDEITDMAVTGAGFGFVAASAKLVWETNPHSIHDRTGPIARYTAGVLGKYMIQMTTLCTLYQATECAARTVRGEDDYMNAFAGVLTTFCSVGFARNQPQRYLKAGVFTGMITAVLAANQWSFYPHRSDGDQYYTRVMKEAEEARAKDLEVAALKKNRVPQTW